MKHLLFLFGALFVLTFLGCKKDVPFSDSLLGTWELSVDINGFSGRPTYHKMGNDTLLKFYSDGRYARYDHNTLTRSGSYTVKQDSLAHVAKNRIIFDGNDADAREFFDIQNNQLSLYLDPTEVSDAGGVGYRRVK